LQGFMTIPPGDGVYRSKQRMGSEGSVPATQFGWFGENGG
jgi:hypothetical protein